MLCTRNSTFQQNSRFRRWRMWKRSKSLHMWESLSSEDVWSCFAVCFISSKCGLIIWEGVKCWWGKTYGIPTISQLLAATKEFSTPANTSKRYADTVILIAEYVFCLRLIAWILSDCQTRFTGHHPHSERAMKALWRMNYIHSQYQKLARTLTKTSSTPLASSSWNLCAGLNSMNGVPWLTWRSAPLARYGRVLVML